MQGSRMGLSAWSMLIALSIVWGGSFFFAEVALREYPPLTIVAVRVIIGAAGLLVVSRVLGLRLPGGWSIWRDLFFMGLLNNFIPFSLIVWGQVHIDSGTASILNATTPFFTVVLAHWLLVGEGLTGAKMFGILLGIAGVGLLAGPTAFSGLTSTFAGQAAVLAAAVSYAFAGVWGKRRLAELPSMSAAAGMLVASSVVMAPLALLIDGVPAAPSGMEMWGALLGIGLLSTSVAYLLYFRILAVAGASNLLLVTMLIPVSALLLGALVLHEAVGTGALAGMAVIGLGLAFIDGRAVDLIRRRADA